MASRRTPSRGPARVTARTGPPPGARGADEPTVRIARKDFRRRRFAGRRRRLVVGGLVVAVLAATAWLVLLSPVLTARDVEVAGVSSLSPVRVERTAAVPLDRPLARVDLGAVTARVETLPAVRSARVSRGWPHTVRIEVTERTPVAVVDRGAGFQALDADGVVFGRYPQRPEELPLVRASSATRTDALVEAGRVVGSLPASVAARVDVVEVATVDRISLALEGGRRVAWGSAQDSAEKAEVLDVLLGQVGDSVREIDVSVPGRPTTR